ncbi:hypothetical protein [Roseicella aerolata]|uniref:Uncharacterized protein n=1 Tax=Roseicella aerolata TaxID=2883479 RepID=A0A9X1LCI7_9PROT|nr:hypothetical protein [Roseicella aerolata]MCB4824230.1 hypothetical protein [Roseicella aerolata]
MTHSVRPMAGTMRERQRNRARGDQPEQAARCLPAERHPGIGRLLDGLARLAPPARARARATAVRTASPVKARHRFRVQGAGQHLLTRHGERAVQGAAEDQGR